MKNNFTLIIIVIVFLAALGRNLHLFDDFFYTKDCLILQNAKFLNTDSMQYTSEKFILVKNQFIYDITEKIPTDFNSCKTVEAQNKFVIPGLTDAHTHLLAADKQRVEDWREALTLSAQKPYMTRLFLGERNAISMLKAGFTTMRDLGNSGNFLDAALDEQLNHQYTARPNLVYSGPGISYKISQINSSVYPSEYKVITDNTTAETLFSDYKKNKATWIKLFADSSTRTDLFEISKLNEIIAAAHRIGFKVALHAENSESEHLALMTDADSIEHFYELPSGDTKQPINNKPTIVLTYVTKATCENLNIEKNCLKKIESLKQTTAWLREHGFKFVFGSDAVLDFSSKFKERGSASLNSLTGLIELGFNNSEILKFATVNAAELLGLKTGQIKKDYKADFVVLNADPLVDIKNLYDRRAVISGGKIFCQTEKECAL